MATSQIKRLKAETGYFVIRVLHDKAGQPYGIDRQPVIHWYCDHDWTPVPITLTGAKDGGNVAVLCPDGIVVQGHLRYTCLDAWFCKNRSFVESESLRARIEDEPPCAILSWSDAQPGDCVVEGGLIDESDPPEYWHQMSPVIKFAIGGNGMVYPVTTRDHIVWNYSTLIRPDGTVHGYDETWPSVDAWAADKLKYELQCKAGQAAKGDEA